jgi:hypothetical protein
MRTGKRMVEDGGMKQEIKGQFSLSMKTIELQVSTLFEDVGGDQAFALLDSLCNLTASEQKIMLDLFTQVVGRVSSGEIRLTTPAESENQQLEDRLCTDIWDAIKAASAKNKEHKLAVLDGGKFQAPTNPSPKIIELSEIRQRRNGTRTR